MIRRIKGVPVEMGRVRLGEKTFTPTGPTYLVEGGKVRRLPAQKRKRKTK